MKALGEISRGGGCYGKRGIKLGEIANSSELHAIPASSKPMICVGFHVLWLIFPSPALCLGTFSLSVLSNKSLLILLIKSTACIFDSQDFFFFLNSEQYRHSPLSPLPHLPLANSTRFSRQVHATPSTPGPNIHFL